MAEDDDCREPSRQASIAWIAFETIAATALALFVSLRFGAPVVWLILPLALIAVGRKSLSDFGFDLRWRPPSWTTHLLLGGSLLLLYAALHAWFAQTILGQGFAPRRPPNLPALVLELA